jgi:hypothetical protein
VSTSRRPESTSTTARTTWLRITPELPRAHPDGTTDHGPGELVGRRIGRPPQRLETSPDGQRHVGAGVAVGHREDVEVVERVAALGQRGVDALEERRELTGGQGRTGGAIGHPSLLVQLAPRHRSRVPHPSHGTATAQPRAGRGADAPGAW